MSERVKISEVCDVFDGPHATPTKTESGPIYLGIDAITDDCRLNPAEFSHLSEEDFRIWTKRVTPRENDIVFSYEATLGRYALIPKGFYGCLGRRLAVVRAKDERINPEWLYYYFLSPEWTAFIKNQKVKGSTVDRISVEDYPGYTIPNIERSKQDAIACILGAIDKKITDNNQICAELESMAKTIYDYWFTQFDFPNAEGKPYRSSGDKMAWNEQLKRDIPEGWRVAKLGDICSFRNGINYEKGVLGDKTYRIINVRNISSSSLLLDDAELDEISLPSVQAEKYLTSSKDIIIARSGTPGATRLLPENSHDVIFCGFIICGSPIFDNQKLYITFSLKSLEGTTATKTGGSILQNVSQDTLKDVYIVVPPSDVLSAFNETLATLLTMIEEKINENNELKRLRDWLLPMLMNGQAIIE